MVLFLQALTRGSFLLLLAGQFEFPPSSLSLSSSPLPSVSGPYGEGQATCVCGQTHVPQGGCGRGGAESE